MDAIDNLVFDTLRKIDVDFDESSLESLSAQQLIKATVNFLWHIDNHYRQRLSSDLLPISISQRYKFAQDVAAAASEVHGAPEIGFETLLYGGDRRDVRRLLLVLCEQTSRALEETVTAQEPEEADSTPLTRLLRRARAQLGGRQEIWTPYYCSRRDEPSSVRWQPSKCLQECSDYRHLPASILHAHNLSLVLSEAQKFEHEHQRGTMPSATDRAKPALPPKPKFREARESAAASELREARLRHAELAERLGHIASLLHQQQSVTGEEEQKLRLRKEQWAQLGSKLLKMLRAPDEARAMLEERGGRQAQLEAKFIEARQERLDELQRLRDAQPDANELDTLRSKVRDFADEIGVKYEYRDRLEATMQRQSAREGLLASRSAYTRRLLELIASTRRQRDDLRRVAADSAHVQREINRLVGRRDRAYTATAQAIRANTARPGELTRCIAQLVALQALCTEHVAVMEAVGTCQRATEQLRAKLALQNSDNVSEALDSAVADYCQLRQQNDALERRLQR